LRCYTPVQLILDSIWLPRCQFPILNQHRLSYPPPAFSADGSKFAVTANDGTLYVWDVRRKIPLIVKEPDRDVHRRVTYPKFSSGILGREVLAVMEVSQLYLYIYFLYVE
jgi:WD40 repeat protein